MNPDLLDAPPDGCTITAYDRAHFTLYMRLLDADADGVDWSDVVNDLFTLDPIAEPERAQRIHAAHLARERWMSEQGYRSLVASPHA